MPILQKQIRSDFTTIHNAFLRDKNFSLNARGLLVTMLSMSDGWNFSIKGLASILPDGEYKVASTLRELEKFGYLKRVRICDERGCIRDWEYHFSDEPIFLDENKENPHRENHDVDEPHRENPDVDNPDVDNPDVDEPDVGNRDDYKITNNQIPKNQISMNQSINQSAAGGEDRIDRVDGREREKYLSLIKENIEYDWFVENAAKYPLYDDKLTQVDELLQIMLDVICSTKKTFRINKEEKPHEVVKSAFLKIRCEHIEYVLTALENNTSEVRNPR